MLEQFGISRAYILRCKTLSPNPSFGVLLILTFSADMYKAGEEGGRKEIAFISTGTIVESGTRIELECWTYYCLKWINLFYGLWFQNEE